MSVTKMPATYSDLVKKEILVISAEVTITEPCEIGTPLISINGGVSFTPLATVEDKPNGILCQSMDESGTAQVLLSGAVKASLVPRLTNQIKIDLFDRAIITL